MINTLGGRWDDRFSEKCKKKTPRLTEMMSTGNQMGFFDINNKFSSSGHWSSHPKKSNCLILWSNLVFLSHFRLMLKLSTQD